MSCAPIFSMGSSSSISLAIVTPSFVMSGAPYFLSRTTFLPLGPSVILTVSASLSIPTLSELRASMPYAISFAIVNKSCLSSRLFRRRLFVAAKPQLCVYDPVIQANCHSTIARISVRLTIVYSTPSSLTSVPEYLLVMTF